MILARVAAATAVVAGILPIGSNADETATADHATVTIWDGVFTEAQAQRGESLYEAPCGKCHGFKLDGAPDDPDMFPTRPIAGPKFLRDWDGRSLAALFEYTRATMPENNPSYLTDDEYAALIAYMLAISGAPAGQQSLGSDPRRLQDIVIERSPQLGGQE